VPKPGKEVPRDPEHLKEVWRTEGVDFKEITQTLGIDWDTKSDTFLMDPHDVIGKYVEGPTTKRQVLQAIFFGTSK